MKNKFTKRKGRPGFVEENPDVRKILARLDAVVLLLATSQFSDADAKIKIAPVAKILHKSGYTPTEIARLFGKKKATDISKYLY